MKKIVYYFPAVLATVIGTTVGTIIGLLIATLVINLDSTGSPNQTNANSVTTHSSTSSASIVNGTQTITVNVTTIDDRTVLTIHRTLNGRATTRVIDLDDPNAR